MRIKVEKLWHGYVSVRSYQVEEALRNGEDIEIVVGSESMLVPAGEVGDGIHNRDNFQSQHDNTLYYHLVDFKWKPNKKQKGLFEQMDGQDYRSHAKKMLGVYKKALQV